MKNTAVDCVTELFAYTYYLVDHLVDNKMEYAQVAENYTMLVAKAREYGKAAGIAKKEFDEALFAVFAWVDEAIFATGWEHKNEWVKNCLQKKYFNTTSAGTKFFEYLAKLKPENAAILEVYDYCLASGFKGSLYESYNQEKLSSIKKNTYKMLHGAGDIEIPGILFPGAGNIGFQKRLKRKRWKGVSDLTSLFILLPVLLFLILYFIFNERLESLIRNMGLVM
ncbi:MAG: DotU family type IV/VI secretion system protein [Desulfobacteraceae bacterium]|nr:DotU family type IV/VI secretion system protein [Desulfobacteraceae bacterium]